MVFSICDLDTRHIYFCWNSSSSRLSVKTEPRNLLCATFKFIPYIFLELYLLGYLHTPNSNSTPQNSFCVSFSVYSQFLSSDDPGHQCSRLSLRSATNWVVLITVSYFLIDLETRRPKYPQSCWQDGSFLLLWDSVLCLGPCSWSSR